MNAKGDALCFACYLSEDSNMFRMLQKHIPFTLVLQKAHIALNLLVRSSFFKAISLSL